ncbi:hypothetical protein CJF42_26255 [Pseudoalteromonas sp. NBT06-2]|uniref:3'-5' exonuclease n=1 Tax=Pseudoalteromonas sp. NBT06-2 TaxID=2025950 RepID=UPI000BA77A3F|nr:3'-5' exonuclease [Pseudoalteromonas sp. NBT06-2]PAJ68762.1 hypothetical protein CJF42_26255 [Pseudoalteromonas sp. NBT06-2]
MDFFAINLFYQSEDARAVFKDGGATELTTALHEFSEWISQIEKLKSRIIWGNGATFDNVILRNAYQACSLEVPWVFYNDRDVRTIVDLGRTLRNFNLKKDMPFTGTVHNALDDAKHQAKYVSAIYQALKIEA